MNRSSAREQGKVREPRKPQAEKDRAHLRQRDLDILRLIGQQIAYRFDQLQALLARHPDTQAKDPAFLSLSQTSRLVKRWEMVTSHTIRHHEPKWISLTQKGLALVGIPAQALDLSQVDLNHLFWINEIRVLIEERYGSRPGFRWESGREYQRRHEHFKTRQAHEPDVHIPPEYQSVHHLDAVLRYRLERDPDAPEIVGAIQIELEDVPYPIWKKIFVDLTYFFDFTHYYVDPALKPSLEKALEQFRNEKPTLRNFEQERRLCIHIHDLEQWL
jgi:hypothetical protein